MPPRSQPTGDPLLKGSDWLKVRAYWMRTRPSCAKCGTPIDTTPGATGPRALDVGHIVERDRAKQLGWTREQINDLSNTQPECRHCSRSTGATYGNRKRGAERAAMPSRGSVTRRGSVPARQDRRRPIESDEW